MSSQVVDPVCGMQVDTANSADRLNTRAGRNISVASGVSRNSKTILTAL
jgi:hypothetical protein